MRVNICKAGLEGLLGRVKRICRANIGDFGGGLGENLLKQPFHGSGWLTGFHHMGKLRGAIAKHLVVIRGGHEDLSGIRASAKSVLSLQCLQGVGKVHNVTIQSGLWFTCLIGRIVKNV